MSDVEIDSRRQPGRFLQPRLGGPGKAWPIAVVVRAPLQYRHDDNRAHCLAAPGGTGSLLALAGGCRAFAGAFLVNQEPWPPSSTSNICTGWLGMIVEIACL